MAIFDDVELEWKGVPYAISGDDRVMRVIAAVEDHLTLFELQTGGLNGRIAPGKLAAAYSVMLRHAGAKVSAAEVYEGMFSDGKTVEKIVEASAGLLQLMAPKSLKVEVPEEQDPDSKPKAKKRSGGKS